MTERCTNYRSITHLYPVPLAAIHKVREALVGSRRLPNAALSLVVAGSILCTLLAWVRIVVVQQCTENEADAVCDEPIEGPMNRLLIYGYVSVLLCGCASAESQAQDPKPAEPVGSRPELAVPTCGPEQSYAYVSRRYRCPDGSNPLNGEVEAARQARYRTLPAPRSDHILDVYRVPCAGGDQEVFVDMYSCQEMENILARARAASPLTNRVLAEFSSANYVGVLALCEPVRSGQFSTGEDFAVCGTLEPAALTLLGEQRAAVSRLVGYCKNMAKKSSLRLDFVAHSLGAVMSGLAQEGKKVSEQELVGILQNFSDACSVAPEEVIEHVEQRAGSEV